MIAVQTTGLLSQRNTIATPFVSTSVPASRPMGLRFPHNQLFEQAPAEQFPHSSHTLSAEYGARAA
jgi:hypothetical protein